MLDTIWGLPLFSHDKQRMSKFCSRCEVFMQVLPTSYMWTGNLQVRSRRLHTRRITLQDMPPPMQLRLIGLGDLSNLAESIDANLALTVQRDQLLYSRNQYPVEPVEKFAVELARNKTKKAKMSKKNCQASEKNSSCFICLWNGEWVLTMRMSAVNANLVQTLIFREGTTRYRS